jgi:hypothetical protein
MGKELEEEVSMSPATAANCCAFVYSDNIKVL